MSLRRSKFQISVELLTAISQGEHKPTRLMYECNLSWGSLKNTLTLLESKGFVEEISEDQKRRHYITTGKGRDVIRYYSGIQELVKVS